MSIRSIFALFSLCVMGVTAVAQAVPPLPDASAAAPKRPRRMHPMALAMANPAAWNEPEHFIAIAVEGDCVDGDWLKGFVPGLIKDCQLRFELVPLEAKDDASSAALLERAVAASGEKARAYILFSTDLKEPIVAAPGSGWAILNPAWIQSDKSVDAETLNVRMGKQLYRAIGMAFGAGFRLEPEAVLRDAATPANLDEALSKNFHPLTLSVIQTVAQRMGLEIRRLKPRSELIELGILPAPKPKAPESAAPAPESK